MPHMANSEDNWLFTTPIDDDDSKSDYSLDYEYIGPREPNYRNEQDADSDCSELSDSTCHNGFDMWDEDPYSTNDFTWESNDMKLTSFIKIRKRELDKVTPWNKFSFYKKDKGWPLQLPFSCSTTNHDQSANSLCLVLSDYGTTERLHAIYRDKIVECGTPHCNKHSTNKPNFQKDQFNTTWLESEEETSGSHCYPLCKSSSSIFHETHASISLPSPPIPPQQTTHTNTLINSNLFSKFIRYTKYIKRSQISSIHTQDIYLSLSFEPLCLAEDYGYMAIGGLEGDNACIFHFTLNFNKQDQLVFTIPKKITIPQPIICTTYCHYTSQHVSWSKSSLYFAHTSDSHNFVLVWRTLPKLEMLYRIDAGGYTYAVQFHPEHEGVLAFTNRYGYLHTVDLNEAISIYNPNQIVSIDQLNSQTAVSNDHICKPSCLSSGNDYIYHTMDLVARQEVTMISFRGEKNSRLRILAKVNGIQWSKDGRHLYVSTKKRVLVYRFIKSYSKIDTLEKMAGLKVLSIMEKHASQKRKRQESEQEKNKRMSWSGKWSQVPKFVRDKVLANTSSLASH
ncbi:hypothetical protein RO3G_09649 [Rhizopus delemar RA 99-880]|uniref:Uncharacterized protein n=1 Tax=Rhizopus delemar (strain RA 99-880 / ATCC MYA-4621 / FGSC 9543 / NRRL 43880) TaxID=246409 RepID=I1C909_RHIO9|nr:hypothetical protein RO3G_09649 [Rhizopus delemar RA 99-880]|eukprot:EIE84939.1 hypothetical protein RO3G_09649 [Rhizopus delemar RA 99-880]